MRITKVPNLILLFALSWLTSIGCTRPVQPQESCDFVQNSSLQRVSWGPRLPIFMSVHNSVPQHMYGDIQAAVDVYNLSMGRELLRIVAWGASGAAEAKADGVSMIYLDSNWDSRTRYTEQGRTMIFYSGSRLYEADLAINGQFFSSYTGVFSAGGTQLDLQSLMVHELGHVLGLAHSSKTGSVMAASLQTGIVRRSLSANDISSLQCEY